MSSITHSTELSPNSRPSELYFAASPQEETLWLGEHEERVNTMTHGFGILLSVIAVVAALWFYDGAELANQIAFVVYGFTLASVYLFSTLSHAVREPRLRNRMRAWDQGMIYTLIVGTYTPFMVRFLDPTVCAGMLIFSWTAAAIGFYSKVFAKHRVNALSTATYLLLGWIPAFPFIGNIPRECGLLMILGGVIYSVGVLFLKYDGRARYFHGVWHLFVMLAGAVHFLTIVRYTLM
jgi:hemolysin III